MSDAVDREGAPEVRRERLMWNNWMTKAGMILTLLSLLALLTFGLFSVIAPANNPYVDVIGLMVIPALLAVGLLAMPLGTLMKSYHLRRHDPTQKLVFQFPRINLNDPRQRRVAKIVVGITVVVLPVMAVSGYHGYHFTDSVEFCGSTCHTVMEPELVTFLESPHARVACAECHIGEGAGWFVKSKLSGTRQVVAVAARTYSRPIPPAITELRPARETCEHCHWPQRFFGSELRRIDRYSSDEDNTHRQIEMVLNTGGAGESFEDSEGIHRHIALEGDLEYVAVDEHLQEIPWVRWTTPSGEELVYRSDGLPISDPPPEGERRHVDCMDCHNRAAHKFESPQQALDHALSSGRIDASLPYVKREAIAALLAAHDGAGDRDQAQDAIAQYLSSFYETEYPHVASSRRADVDRAIQTTQRIYGQGFFPYMRIDWRTYPDNVGHLFSPGCFRCHDGNHVNQHGDPISHECSTCHTFLNASYDGDRTLLEHGEFQHPVPLGVGHEKLGCYQCHGGGASPDPTCEGCHVEQQSLYAGEVAYLEQLGVDAEPNIMFDIAACEDCHDTSEPHELALVRDTCVACHDDDEGYGEILDDWMTELAEARAEAAAVVSRVQEGATDPGKVQWAATALEVLDALARAGDQHNPDMSLQTYELLAEQGQEQLDLPRSGDGPASR